MRFRRGYLVVAGVLGAAAAVLPSIANSETPSIEAVNAGLYSHYWSPTQATVSAGGVIAIRNSTTTPHGVEWKSGPATPQCSSGVPVGTSPAASGANWSGTCTFSQPGTYTFYCTVHGPEMTETVTVGATGTTTTTMSGPTTPTTPGTTPGTPTTTTPQPAETHTEGPIAGGLSLRASQRGRAVRGSLRIAPAAAGGRLEVEVFAEGSALGGKRNARRVLVGSLKRGGLSAGEMSFTVALDRAARRALARRRRLRLAVQITIVPVRGKPSTFERTVVEHA